MVHNEPFNIHDVCLKNKIKRCFVKKISLLICILLSVTLLTACSSSLASTSPNSETALIQVVNNSDEKINLVELHFHQYGKQISTQGGTYADGSALKKGDFLGFELSNIDVDLTDPITIEVSAEIDNVKRSAGAVQSIQLSKGNAFHFEITEDSSFSNF